MEQLLQITTFGGIEDNLLDNKIIQRNSNPPYWQVENEMYVCIFGFKGASTSKVIGARNEMMMDDYDGQMIFGDFVGLKLPDIRLTGEEKPRKTSPRKLVLTGDRTRACCVTSAHATRMK